MTCTERCRKAHPGHCCCECAGEHHGEAAPVQQRHLALDFKPFDKDQMADDFRAAMASEREVLMGVAVAASEEIWDSVEAMTSQRKAHDRELDGRTVRLVPGRRYTHDGDSPIWRAHLGGKCASDVDPERAARKVLEL